VKATGLWEDSRGVYQAKYSSLSQRLMRLPPKKSGGQAGADFPRTDCGCLGSIRNVSHSSGRESIERLGGGVCASLTRYRQAKKMAHYQSQFFILNFELI